MQAKIEEVAKAERRLPRIEAELETAQVRIFVSKVKDTVNSVPLSVPV